MKRKNKTPSQQQSKKKNGTKDTSMPSTTSSATALSTSATTLHSTFTPTQHTLDRYLSPTSSSTTTTASSIESQTLLAPTRSTSEPIQKKKKTIPLPSKEKIESNQLTEMVLSYIKEDWNAIEPNTIESRIRKTCTSLNHLLIRRTWELSNFLTAVMSPEVLMMIEDIVNRNLCDKRTMHDSSYNKFHVDLRLGELLIFFGAVVYLENNHSKLRPSISENYRKLKKLRGKDVMCQKRFTAIITCLCPNENEFRELVDLLNNQFNKLVCPGTKTAFDETVYAYHVSKEIKQRAEQDQDPIPVVFIPRKPHPNGLMSYKLSTILPGGKPYTLVLIPHYSIPQISPTCALNEAITQFKKFHPNNVLHVIADSAFGSFPQLQKMEEDGVFGTFSMVSTEKSWLWKLLKRSTYSNNWNAAMSGSCIASVFNSKDLSDDKGDGFHHLYTNAFKAEKNLIEITVNGESQFNSSQEETDLPVFTREFLESKTKEALVKICNEQRIKKGKLTKPQLINQIMDICNPTDEKARLVKETRSKLENTNIDETPIHHVHYRECFGFVDRQNKSYYKAPFTYAVRNWRSKMVLAIMNDSFYNVFALMNAMERVRYVSFRERLEDILFEVGKAEKFSNKN